MDVLITYIGDAGTSVTSLFGMAGKPMFILNNNIHTMPKEDDWKGSIIKAFNAYASDNCMITQGNKLYYSANSDFQYQYCCDLSPYANGNYYAYPIQIDDKIYVCPQNAQDILVIRNRILEKCIKLEYCMEQAGAFRGAIKIGQYLFLIPFRYPGIVRYDVISEKIDYIKGYNHIFGKMIEGQWKLGGYCAWKDCLLIASPDTNQIVVIQSKSLKVQIVTISAKYASGYAVLVPDGMDIWLFSLFGKTIVKWNPETGYLKEFLNIPKRFVCKQRPYGYECEEHPFGWAIRYKEYIYISPAWGNMFLRLNKETGEIKEWIPPIPLLKEEKNGYY